MNFYVPSSYFSLSILNKRHVAKVIPKILRYGLALVLAVAGIAKLIDASTLLKTLQQVPFVHDSLAIWLSTLLPVVELGLAAALFLQWKPFLTTTLTLGLFTVFLGFSMYGLIMNLTGGCGCFGNLAESSFGWSMILRNLVLFLVAGLLWARKLRS